MTGVAVLAGLVKTAADAAAIAGATLVAVRELTALMEKNQGADLTPEQLEPFIARRKEAEAAWDNRDK